MGLNMAAGRDFLNCQPAQEHAQQKTTYSDTGSGDLALKVSVVQPPRCVTCGPLLFCPEQDAPVAEFVYQHPVWMWAVGPAFAALTGAASLGARTSR